MRGDASRLLASSLRRRSRRRRSWRGAASRWRTTAMAPPIAAQQQQRDATKNLIGTAPAEMIDQDLRRGQQDQDAGAGRGIHDRHRGRQSRAEPAAQQDRVRNVADKGDTEADAKAETELELPEMLGVGGDQERTAKQSQSERIDHPGA